ncbi:unnamed protein product [Hyaloperonospora brassicae]|uniref:RxLR effector candidate protein n=1 Tax=Hyaloperonospora brassicae TaxID=162125 RepID=A0AAV0V4Q7_HYABA|nr:unnamed protein product [Hyaloperonospora brassicae]
MVHWGTVFVTVTAASFLLGRRELPKLGRFVGLYTGRSIGAIIRAKSEFFDATRDNDLVKLQREFQRGIEELNDIRSELTSVGRMRRPFEPLGKVSKRGGHAGTSGTVTPSSVSHSVPAAPTALHGGRSSVALASTAEYSAQDTSRRNVEASLALAEVKLQEEGKFATRVESVEGGADYVSASIMDSLLLDSKKTTT